MQHQAGHIVARAEHAHVEMFFVRPLGEPRETQRDHPVDVGKVLRLLRGKADRILWKLSPSLDRGQKLVAVFETPMLVVV